MRIILLIFLVLITLPSLGDDYDYIFRFNSQHTSDRFIVGNNLLNFHDCSGSSDWVSVSFTENYQSVLFFVKQPETLQNRKSVMFTINYYGSNVFEHVVMEPRIYRFICQWDDEGFVNEDEDCSASLLRNYEGFISLSLDGDDMDKWVFIPQKQGYCFEVTATNDFLLEARQNGNEFGEPERIISSQNDNLFSKRLYVTNAVLGRPIDFIVSRPETSENETIGYRFSLRPVRPLVLVHGIRSSPTWHGDHNTSFGDLKAKASIYGDFPPCIVFDFPWNSNKGSITDYCGDKSSEFNLYGFSHKRCGDWKLKPVFFTHSMGGLLLIEQMKNREFRGAVDGAIFAGSPFCGSDIANAVLQTDIGRKLKIGADLLNKTQTTIENFKLLARGSKSISERLKKIDTGFPVLFLIGGFTNDKITGRGDKRVNISSSSLYNTLLFPGEDHLVVNMEHGELVDIALPPESKYYGICKKIKSILEH